MTRAVQADVDSKPPAGQVTEPSQTSTTVAANDGLGVPEASTPAVAVGANAPDEAGALESKSSADGPDAGQPSLVANIEKEKNAGETFPSAVEGDGDEFKTVGFEKLSAFEFEMSDDILNPPAESDTNITARTEAMIPEEVRAYDKKRVALKGFMLPLKVEGGLVTELLVMKDQSMCCFGTVPKINEWVSVKMVEKGVKPIMDQPVTLFGKLNVGEMRENGYLVGIYSMDGEKMAGPLDN